MDRETWDAYILARDAGARRTARNLMDILMRANEGLLRRCVTGFLNRSQYRSHGVEEDVMQAARIGFMQAVDRWKPDLGAFSALAFMQMRHEMQKAICALRHISLPRDVAFAREPEPGEEPKTRRARMRAETKHIKFIPIADGLGFENIGAENGIVARPLHTDRAASHREGQDRRLVTTPNIPDAEGDIDRARDVGYLKEWLATLSKADVKLFWTGKDEGLNARAKAHVEGARAR